MLMTVMFIDLAPAIVARSDCLVHGYDRFKEAVGVEFCYAKVVHVVVFEFEFDSFTSSPKSKWISKRRISSHENISKRLQCIKGDK